MISVDGSRHQRSRPRPACACAATVSNTSATRTSTKRCPKGSHGAVNPALLASSAHRHRTRRLTAIVGTLRAGTRRGGVPEPPPLSHRVTNHLPPSEVPDQGVRWSTGFPKATFEDVLRAHERAYVKMVRTPDRLAAASAPECANARRCGTSRAKCSARVCTRCPSRRTCSGSVKGLNCDEMIL